MNRESLNEPQSLTKRIVLSQINRMFDPLGLVGAVTSRGKILMRKLWTGPSKDLGWDDIVSQELMEEWSSFFKELLELNDISFARCIKPDNAIGNPSLVIFTDGSNHAFDACACIRWKHPVLNTAREFRSLANYKYLQPIYSPQLCYIYCALLFECDYHMQWP